MIDPENIEHWVIPHLLFDNGKLHSGRAVGIVSDTVAIVAPVAKVPHGSPQSKFDGILSPGFVDLQVNGGGGVLINTTPTKEGMRTVAAAHRKFGTTSILPTVITDAPEIMERAVDAVIQAHGTNGIAGIHIEGPHISVDRRGTHNVDYIRPIDAETIELVTRARSAGIPTMITLAPDVVPPRMIEELVNLGAVVSIGHSCASGEVVRGALHAGARCFTHLFNAMSPLAGREPGVVGSAINSQAYVGIICDGIHVADEMIGLAIRARPTADRTFLVSDAMPTVGGPDAFDLYGRTIRLECQRLINEEGSLAGAHTTQAEGVRRLVEKVGLPVETALKMAITIPAQVMGLQLDGVQGRNTSDIICLNDGLDYQRTLSDVFRPTET